MTSVEARPDSFFFQSWELSESERYHFGFNSSRTLELTIHPPSERSASLRQVYFSHVSDSWRLRLFPVKSFNYTVAVPSLALAGIKGPEGRKFFIRPASDESVVTPRLLRLLPASLLHHI